MTMRRWFIVGATIAVALLILLMRGVLHGQKSICFDEWAPYEYMKDGEPAGASVDIVRAALRRMGEPEGDMALVPWKRGLNKILTGQSDILISGMWTQERNEVFRYPEESLGCVSWRLYAIDPNNIPQDPIVGVASHFALAPALQELLAGKIIDDTAPDGEQLLLKLMSSRVDMVLLETKRLEFLEKTVNATIMPASNTVYVPLYPLFSPAVSKEFIDAFNAELRRMWQDGSIKAIHQQYGLVCPEGLQREVKK